MKKEFEFNINKKKVTKKLEEIAKKKYPPTYISSEHNESELLYSPSRTWYTPENSIFVPANKNTLYNKSKQDIPFGYHKIKCHRCEHEIVIPMGYSNCPRCGKMVYADKNTDF